MRPLYLLDSQLFHLSLLPSIKLKYLRGVIKVALLFEDFWYLFGINSVHDAVAHKHTEPLSFAWKLSVQYNTFFTTLLMDFCKSEMGVILCICVVRIVPHHMLEPVYVNVFKMLEGWLYAVCSGYVIIIVFLHLHHLKSRCIIKIWHWL